MHTNYVDYARRMAGDTAAATLRRLNRFLCRQHTHKVIKLSDAVQDLPRQETCFVHGVSNGFLAVGDSIAEAGRPNKLGSDDESKKRNVDQQSSLSTPVFTKGAYFLGKALWAKGFGELVDRCTEHKVHCEARGRCADFIDAYGMGPQLEAIKQEVHRRGLALRFLGPKDHLSPEIAAYRTFVNPSTSDVVATTSAEALAMGKWLVVPLHPCNEFFSTFQNCLVYDSAEEFSSVLERTFVEEPAPLNDEERRRLTWEAATDRFLHCCASVELARGPPLARVAAMTGWVGYNVGYQVYQVANVAIELVQRALVGAVDADEGRTGQGSGRGILVSHPLQLDLEAYPSTLSGFDDLP
jgi:digalactosyldiacylglycerol synthase